MRQYARWITIQALWKDSWCQSTRFIFYCVTFIKFSASQYLSLLICKLRSCCNTLYLLEVEWDNTKIWNNRLRCLQQGLALIQFSSVQFSHSVMSVSLRPPGLQHARLPCPSRTLGAVSNSRHQVGDAIQPSHPLSSPSPPTFNLSQDQGFFQWVSSSY